MSIRWKFPVRRSLLVKKPDMGPAAEMSVWLRLTRKVTRIAAKRSWLVLMRKTAQTAERKFQLPLMWKARSW